MIPSRLARLLGLALLALAALTACTTSAAPALPSADPGADAAISSGSMSFDSDALAVPAGRPFTLSYVNRTPMPHNVAIYTDASASQKLFVGEVIGEGRIDYEVPALPTGELFFRCDLHPEMSGKVVSQ